MRYHPLQTFELEDRSRLKYGIIVIPKNKLEEAYKKLNGNDIKYSYLDVINLIYSNEIDYKEKIYQNVFLTTENNYSVQNTVHNPKLLLAFKLIIYYMSYEFITYRNHTYIPCRILYPQTTPITEVETKYSFFKDRIIKEQEEKGYYTPHFDFEFYLKINFSNPIDPLKEIEYLRSKADNKELYLISGDISVFKEFGNLRLFRFQRDIFLALSPFVIREIYPIEYSNNHLHLRVKGDIFLPKITFDELNKLVDIYKNFLENVEVRTSNSSPSNEYRLPLGVRLKVVNTYDARGYSETLDKTSLELDIPSMFYEIILCEEPFAAETFVKLEYQKQNKFNIQVSFERRSYFYKIKKYVYIVSKNPRFFFRNLDDLKIAYLTNKYQLNTKIRLKKEYYFKTFKIYTFNFFYFTKDLNIKAKNSIQKYKILHFKFSVPNSRKLKKLTFKFNFFKSIFFINSYLVLRKYKKHSFIALKSYVRSKYSNSYFVKNIKISYLKYYYINRNISFLNKGKFNQKISKLNLKTNKIFTRLLVGRFLNNSNYNFSILKTSALIYNKKFNFRNLFLVDVEKSIRFKSLNLQNKTVNIKYHNLFLTNYLKLQYITLLQNHEYSLIVYKKIEGKIKYSDKLKYFYFYFFESYKKYYIEKSIYLKQKTSYKNFYFKLLFKANSLFINKNLSFIKKNSFIYLYTSPILYRKKFSQYVVFYFNKNYSLNFKIQQIKLKKYGFNFTNSNLILDKKLKLYYPTQTLKVKKEKINFLNIKSILRRKKDLYSFINTKTVGKNKPSFDYINKKLILYFTKYSFLKSQIITNNIFDFYVKTIYFNKKNVLSYSLFRFYLDKKFFYNKPSLQVRKENYSYIILKSFLDNKLKFILFNFQNLFIKKYFINAFGKINKDFLKYLSLNVKVGYKYNKFISLNLFINSTIKNRYIKFGLYVPYREKSNFIKLKPNLYNLTSLSYITLYASKGSNNLFFKRLYLQLKIANKIFKLISLYLISRNLYYFKKSLYLKTNKNYFVKSDFKVKSSNKFKFLNSYLKSLLNKIKYATISSYLKVNKQKFLLLDLNLFKTNRYIFYNSNLNISLTKNYFISFYLQSFYNYRFFNILIKGIDNNVVFYNGILKVLKSKFYLRYFTLKNHHKLVYYNTNFDIKIYNSKKYFILSKVFLEKDKIFYSKFFIYIYQYLNASFIKFQIKGKNHQYYKLKFRIKVVNDKKVYKLRKKIINSHLTVYKVYNKISIYQEIRKYQLKVESNIPDILKKKIYLIKIDLDYNFILETIKRNLYSKKFIVLKTSNIVHNNFSIKYKGQFKIEKSNIYIEIFPAFNNVSKFKLFPELSFKIKNLEKFKISISTLKEEKLKIKHYNVIVNTSKIKLSRQYDVKIYNSKKILTSEKKYKSYLDIGFSNHLYYTIRYNIKVPLSFFHYKDIVKSYLRHQIPLTKVKITSSKKIKSVKYLNLDLSYKSTFKPCKYKKVNIKVDEKGCKYLPVNIKLDKYYNLFVTINIFNIKPQIEHSIFNGIFSTKGQFQYFTSYITNTLNYCKNVICQENEIITYNSIDEILKKDLIYNIEKYKKSSVIFYKYDYRIEEKEYISNFEIVNNSKNKIITRNKIDKDIVLNLKYDTDNPYIIKELTNNKDLIVEFIFLNTKYYNLRWINSYKVEKYNSNYNNLDYKTVVEYIKNNYNFYIIGVGIIDDIFDGILYRNLFFKNNQRIYDNTDLFKLKNINKKVLVMDEVWSEENIQKCFELSSEYNFTPSYYCNCKVERIFNENYNQISSLKEVNNFVYISDLFQDKANYINYLKQYNFDLVILPLEDITLSDIEEIRYKKFNRRRQIVGVINLSNVEYLEQLNNDFLLKASELNIDGIAISLV